MTPEDVARQLEQQGNRCAYEHCRFGTDGGAFRAGHRLALAYDGEGLVHVECATVAIVNTHGKIIEPKR